MIIYQKYTQKVISKDRKKIKTTLEAKFDFNLNIIRPHPEENTVADYLRDVEGISIYEKNKNIQFDYDKNKNRTIIIKAKGRQMNLKVISYKKLKQEEMLNLEALDNFIRTGEYPKNQKPITSCA